jgi:hypothetical protein
MPPGFSALRQRPKELFPATSKITSKVWPLLVKSAWV